MERIAALALICLEGWACYLLGRGLLRRLGLEFANLAEEVAFCASVGLGALAYAVLAVGLMGGLNRLGLGGVILVLLACAGAEAWRARRARKGKQAKKEKQEGLGAFEMVALGMALAVVGILLGGSLAPPGGGDWDSLSYHLAVPKIYLADGRIHYVPFTHQSNFPFTMEMLYTLGLFLNGAALAKLNHLLALGLTLALLFGLGRRFWGRTAGTVALACYVSAPIVLLEAGTAYIDLGYALYYLLAASAFVIWWVEGKKAWLIASGIFCGLCLGTKMTGAIGFGSLAALLIYRVAKERRGWQDLAAFVLPSVLVAAPWYLKSQIWTGNPTYPFFYGLFGGRNWDAAMATAYRIEQEKFGLGSGILQLLLLPINLAFRHEHFMDVGYARPLGSPGILWLCLLPPLLLLRKHDRALKVILAAAALGSLGWFYSMQQVRYFLPILALLSLGTGYAAGRLWRDRPLRWAGQAAAIAVLAVAALLSVLLTGTGWRVVLGLQGQREYLESSFPAYRAFEYINNRTPVDSKVVTFGEPRDFYCDRPYFWGDPNHNQVIDRERGSSAEGLAAELRRLGVTHALVPDDWLASRDSELERLKVPEFRHALRQAIQLGLLQKRFDDGFTTVLQVEGEGEGG